MDGFGLRGSNSSFLYTDYMGLSSQEIEGQSMNVFLYHMAWIATVGLVLGLAVTYFYQIQKKNMANNIEPTAPPETGVRPLLQYDPLASCLHIIGID